MSSRATGLILLLLAGAGTSNAAPPSASLAAAPTGRAPVIDGSLTDSCWQRAAMASGFVTYAGKWAVEQTTALVTYDEDYLYLSFRCIEPSTDKLVVHTEQHDAEPLFNDDRIEIFLDVNRDRRSYYHFVVNSTGARYDARCRIEEGQIRRDVEWNPDVDIATRTGSDAWTIEMRVPFVAFGGSAPEAGDRWGVNFAREQRTIDLTENSNWAMVPDGLNRPREFGDLVFGHDTGPSYSIDAVADRLGDYELILTLRNPGERSLSATVLWRLKSAWMKPVSVAVRKQVASGSDERFRLRPTNEELEFAGAPRTAVREVVAASLEISDARTGRVYEARTAQIVTPVSMDMAISRYYYRAGDTEARIALTHGLDRAGSFDIEVHGDLHRKPLIEQTITCQPGRRDYEMSFDLTGLDWGRYVVTAGLTDADGEQVFTMDRIFFKGKPRRLPAKFRPVRKASVREDGTLLLNGRPFFPFSASQPATVSALAAASFNTYYWPQEKPTGMETPDAVAFERVGMPWITRDPDGGIVTLFPEEATLLRTVRSRVEPARSDPRLYGWHIQYEAQFPVFRDTTPRTRLNTPLEYGEISNYIKQIDPDHLTVLQLQLLDNVELMAPYRNAADIIELALPPSYARRMVPHLIDNMQRTRTLLGPGTPFVLWLGSTVPSPRYRTAEEIRCVSYLALLHGAAGLVYHMGHGDLDPTAMSRHWSLYQGLHDEIQWLFDIMATSSSVATLVVVEPDEIDHRAIEHDGRIYIVAVNTSPALVEGRVSLPEHTIHAKRVGVPLEHRTVRVEGHGFSDTFTAFEPHVYELTRGSDQKSD